MPAPPLSTTEAVVNLFWWIARSFSSGIGARLPGPVVSFVIWRLQNIRQRFARLAASIVAGTYKPRRYTPRTATAPRKPRPPSPIPQKFGWLDTWLPEASAIRGHLLHHMQQPEMLALIAAAPGPMARTLRPLFWMLKLKPPAILPNPRRPAGTPPPPPPPAYQAPPPRAPAPPVSGPPNTLGLHPIQLAPLRPPPKIA